VPDHYIPYSPTIDPEAVVAMRIAILVNSGEPIRSRKGAETHVLLDEELSTNERVARNVFSSTVMLRNIR